MNKFVLCCVIQLHVFILTSSLHQNQYHHSLALAAVFPKKTQPAKKSDEQAVPIAATGIYSKPSLYDLAFGYRSYEDEVAFLVQAHKTNSLSHSVPKAILELAAGPARHSLTALSCNENFSSITHATAVDLSSDMKDYALHLATSHYSREARNNCRGSVNIIHHGTDANGGNMTNIENRIAAAKDPNASTFEYTIQDITCFIPPKPSLRVYDSAWILLGSLQHLQTTMDVIKCFQSIHRVLSEDGTLIVELSHPKETFNMLTCTRNTWEVPIDLDDGAEGTLKVLWGDESDEFDPIKQLRDLTVQFELDAGAFSTNVTQIIPTRLFTSQEMNALAYGGGFEVVQMYGSLNEDVDVYDTELAYRMVCVLRKRKDLR